MNPLDHAGTPMQLALCKPDLSFRQTDNGPAYRVSFEVTQETHQRLSATRNFKKLILEAQLMMVNHDDRLVGGYQSNLAAMMCKDASFHVYLDKRALSQGTAIEMGQKFQQIEGASKAQKWEKYAKAWVCHNCGVESRKELDHSDSALAKFAQLKRAFAEYCKINNVNCKYLGS